jgi:pyridinium-3,5-bisthiocarboxylic acid mononucleotide nickel chelatase
VFDRLARAEAEVHATELSEVTFHEVGATDSIVDIVGAAAALEFVGAQLVTSPLPIGRGFVHTQHGRLPLPAPATLLCLRGVPTVEDPLELELVTPTGAAIVSALSQRFVSWPGIVPERVGFGAGTLELPDRPNALRAVLGTSTQGAEAGDRVNLLEANIDDMTGEVLAHALGRLLECGALDAWIVPITMKKGRPAWTLCALATRDTTPTVEATYFAETTTLGVRRREIVRTTLPRKVTTVSTQFGPVPVKQSGSPPHHLKPEFEACVQLAKQHGVPLRVVMEEAFAQARSRR